MMSCLFLICYFFILIGIILLLICIFKKKKDSKKLIPHTKDRYAIIIPARDESNVIQNLLDSIHVQNKNMSNVYIIVEDEQDKTCDIAKKYKTNVFIRKQPFKHRKGYALDECIKNILQSEHYDLYFIFDADNILEKNYIKNMLESWHQGYDVAIGYRNILNPVNWISGCSILLFSLMNTIINKNSVKNNNSIILSGTGLYISGEIIEKLKGFPFYTLTEDYELSLYLRANNISSIYNEKAIFFDEQPIDMKSSIKQRTRWVYGFFEARKKRLRNVQSFSTKIGVLPFVFIIFSVVFLSVLSIINVFFYKRFFATLIIVPLIFYIVLVILTLILLIKENKQINIEKKLKIKCLFLNPLFLLTFLFCLFKCLMVRNITWEKIKHNGI